MDIFFGYMKMGYGIFWFLIGKRIMEIILVVE